MDNLRFGTIGLTGNEASPTPSATGTAAGAGGGTAALACAGPRAGAAAAATAGPRPRVAATAGTDTRAAAGELTGRGIARRPNSEAAARRGPGQYPHRRAAAAPAGGRRLSRSRGRAFRAPRTGRRSSPWRGPRIHPRGRSDNRDNYPGRVGFSCESWSGRRRQDYRG